EERGGGERQVARAAAEQRPARRQRHVHEAGERQRNDELAAVGGQGERPAGDAEEHEQVAQEDLPLAHRANSPFGRSSSTAMNTAYDSSDFSDGLVKCM